MCSQLARTSSGVHSWTGSSGEWVIMIRYFIWLMLLSSVRLATFSPYGRSRPPALDVFATGAGGRCSRRSAWPSRRPAASPTIGRTVRSAVGRDRLRLEDLLESGQVL